MWSLVTHEIVGCYIGKRSEEATIRLWKSLPPVCRQCAITYTDYWQACATVLPSRRHRAVGDEFLAHIQEHWGIENRCHWVRDVALEEGYARLGGNAPVVWAILNCFLLSIMRQLGDRSIPQET